MKKKKMLCITRKYPPQVGGMENFSYHLLNGLGNNEYVETKIISLGKGQKHLLWFFPYTCFYVLFHVRKYDIIFVGDAVLCFLGVLSRWVSPGTKRIINVFGLDITFQNSFYQWYLNRFYKNCSDLFISISRGTDELLHQKWGDLKSVIITPGILPKAMTRNIKEKQSFREKYKIPAYHKVLLTVGRLVERKGVGWFIQNVMPLLKAEPVSYFVIGDGKERDNVRAVLEKSGMENQVHLMGRVEQEVLDFFYENADVFVMPNIEVEGDKEGFGIVAAEASTAGLIVVASEIEGIGDAIIDDKNGYLLPAGDCKAFRDKICDICHNWEKYEKKREIFSAYTNKHFNWDYICQKYVDEIARLMQGDGDA